MADSMDCLLKTLVENLVNTKIECVERGSFYELLLFRLVGLVGPFHSHSKDVFKMKAVYWDVLDHLDAAF